MLARTWGALLMPGPGLTSRARLKKEKGGSGGNRLLGFERRWLAGVGSLLEERKDRISIDSTYLFFALTLVCRRIRELSSQDRWLQPSELLHLQEYVEMVIQEHEHALDP